MIDLNLDALIETAVNAAQIESGVNPRLVMARSKTAVSVAALQTDGVNPRSGVWTAEEDAFLRDNLGVLSQEEIADHLGRTVAPSKFADAARLPRPQQAARRLWPPGGQMLGMCGEGYSPD